MYAPPLCPDCGSPLPRNAPGGMCPKCLLEQGFDDDAPSTGPTFVPAFGQPQSAGIPQDLVAALPQFEVLELLGQGGMGTVYKARQIALDRIVALKVMSRRDPEFAERFSREVRLMARLNHPHIVAVYDFGQMGELCYFTMEFVEGANLRECIRSGNLTVREALAIVPQLCEALQYAHDEGIVHRDIKPENLLLDRKGRLKVADFGLARLLDDNQSVGRLTGTRQVMGTLGYMAPEQLEGTRGVDHRADIYSLGVVLYELLTGELPLGRFEPPSKVAPVDARLDNVVLRTLDRQPDRRYQKASDVAVDVEAIRNSPEGPAEFSSQEYATDSSMSGTWSGKWRRLQSGTQPVTFTLLCLMGLGGVLGVVVCLGLIGTMFVSLTPTFSIPTETNSVDSEAQSPLVQAIGRGDLADIRRQLDFGADPNERRPNRDTVLSIAAGTGNVSMVRALCRAGAVVDDRNSKGITPLMIAAYRGHTGVVTELIAAGADVHCRGDEGLTALDEAVAGGHPSTVQLLIDKSAPRTANLVLWQAWKQVRAKRYEHVLESLRADQSLIDESTTPVRFRIDDWQYDAQDARVLMIVLRLECHQVLGNAAEFLTEWGKLQRALGTSSSLDLYVRRQLSARSQSTHTNDPDNFQTEAVHVRSDAVRRAEQNPQLPIEVEIDYRLREVRGHIRQESSGSRTDKGLIR